MIECKAVSTPLENNNELYSGDGTKEVNGTLYCKLVGSLNYLTTPRPDIAYSINILSQLMAKSCESHQKATKKVQYVKGALNFGILYIEEFDVELAGYSDFDQTGNLDDRKSITGYVFNIGSRAI